MFYVNKADLGSPCVTYGRGLISRGTHLGMSRWELFSPTFPTPDFQGGQRGWRLSRSPVANGLIGHAYGPEPP